MVSSFTAKLHPCMGVLSELFPSGFQTKIMKGRDHSESLGVDGRV